MNNDPCRIDLHQHLSWTWTWLWYVFVYEVIGTATAVDTDRFHFLSSSFREMMNLTGQVHNPDHRQGAVIG